MATVRVRLLGPVDVLADGVARGPAGVRRKALLAALALQAGRVVSSTRLLDLVWGESPPAAAANALQQHISHLRTTLGMRSAIVARSRGYLLDLDAADATDLAQAERLIREAASPAEPARRLARLRAAVALWDGPPLAELRELAWFDEQARQLDELLLRTRLELLEVRLALGEGAQVYAELEALGRAHPLHEDIAGLLMRALYAAGRQADAFAVAQRLRRTLGEDLGVDPGPRLGELEAAILRHDPALGRTPAPVVAPPLAPPRPAQLPLAVAGFTGRATELSRLDAMLGPATGDGALPAPVGVIVVSGTAGVGKTTLAVRWAHRIAGRFPDGQLYLNLRGYDPEQRVSPADALAGFLRALGVAGQDIPLDMDERAARYRTALAGRRVLVVLDNAGSVDQVRPLLPGTAGCAAVVTSRDSLAGLVALDGALRLDLDLLPVADAVTLLGRLIGARVPAEPAAAEELAEQCARLPLALRVAAELAAAQPDSSLAGLTKELGDRQRRLDLLDAGREARTAVRSVFSWSYQDLPDPAARAFRLLGLHPGADFDAGALAALTGGTVEGAGRICAQLARASLLSPHGLGRYSLHDLLRAYAMDLADARDSEADRRAALGGLFDYYLAGAAAAMDTLHPAERHKRPAVAAVPARPALNDPAAARDWLDAERPNLVAVCAWTVAHGWADHTIRLAQILFRYLDMGGHHTEALAIHHHAHQAARATGDRAAEARALNNVAAVYWWRALYPLATACYREAVDLFRAAGDRVGEADALSNLGVVARSVGDVAAAAGHHEQALGLYRELGNVIGQGHALTGLGIAYMMAGDYDRAVARHQQALLRWREAGKTDGEADTLASLGRVYLRQGDLDRAAEHLELALARYRQHGYPGAEANALNGLGQVFHGQGDLARAIECHEQALVLNRRDGTRTGEAAGLNGLAETLRTAGAWDQARGYHAEAMALATAVGDRYQQANAHQGLAALAEAAGETAEARAHWERALDIFTVLGTADADQIRGRLRLSAQGCFGDSGVSNRYVSPSPSTGAVTTTPRSAPRPRG